MFRSGVDYRPYHDRLAITGRVQVPNILDDTYLELVRSALADETPWELSYQVGAEPEVVEWARYVGMDAAQRSEFVARVAAEVRGRYGYAFENYSVKRHFLNAERAEHLLHKLVDVFHYEPILDFIRQLTGDAAIDHVLMQATRYLPGHFLRRHDDNARHEDQKRRFAFVFNLGQRWQADWGGLLQFLDDEGRVVESFVPEFNSLSLFKVPQLHCVSQVAPWAESPRLALTGWFLGP